MGGGRNALVFLSCLLWIVFPVARKLVMRECYEKMLGSWGHCFFGGSSPPSHWMAPLSELFLLLFLLPDELAYIKRDGQTQL